MIKEVRGKSTIQIQILRDEFRTKSQIDFNANLFHISLIKVEMKSIFSNNQIKGSYDFLGAIHMALFTNSINSYNIRV